MAILGALMVSRRRHNRNRMQPTFHIMWNCHGADP
jgi:hypothetical protein